MPKFRAKPIVIEAVRWVPPLEYCNFDRYGRYINHKVGVDQFGVEHTVTECCIQTPEGPMRISQGDWIVTGVTGNRYPCKPGVLAETYELAD